MGFVATFFLALTYFICIYNSLNLLTVFFPNDFLLQWLFHTAHIDWTLSNEDNVIFNFSSLFIQLRVNFVTGCTGNCQDSNFRCIHRQRFRHYHWGQPHEATVVKMAPTRPLASRSFCLLVLLCDHRSLSNLQQRNTEAWYTLHQNDRFVPFLVFVQ